MRAWIARERKRVSSAAVLYRSRLDAAEKWLNSDGSEQPDRYTAEIFETCLGVERMRYGLDPGFVVNEKRVRTSVPIGQWNADVAALKSAAVELGAPSLGLLRRTYRGLFDGETA